MTCRPKLADRLDGAAARPRRGRLAVRAIGVRDALPDVAGLHEQWGKTVLHSPYHSEPAGICGFLPIAGLPDFA
jgi:hypothetical protein